jgi:hypothetical protein
MMNKSLKTHKQRQGQMVDWKCPFFDSVKAKSQIPQEKLYSEQTKCIMNH